MSVKCNNDECCCICKNQIELFKHPWNKINKGSVTDSTNMYVCIVEHNIDKTNKGILFEKKHSSCELHQPK
jgi:hypothetical protein